MLDVIAAQTKKIVHHWVLFKHNNFERCIREYRDGFGFIFLLAKSESTFDKSQ